MGKGARNRKRRRQEAAADPVELISQLFTLETADEFAAFAEAHPSLLSDRTLQALEHLKQAEGYAAHFEEMQSLLRASRDDPRRAWSEHRAWVETTQRRADEGESRVADAEAAFEAGAFEDALAAANATLPEAVECGHGALVADVHSLRGRALMRTTLGSRVDNVDNAVEAFEQALEHAVSGDQAAALLDLLGGALASRLRGDRTENVRRAAAAQRAGLEQLGPDSPPEQVAAAQTNLASTLVTGEGGDREADLREAADLCRRALEFRSPQRNGVDWAYSQLNRAIALERLAGLERVEPTDAIAAFEAVSAEGERIAEPWMVGEAHASLGRLHLAAARPDAQAIFDADERGDLEGFDDDRPRLELARWHLEAARPLIGAAPDPELGGRLLRDLASACEALGDTRTAQAVAVEAVKELTVNASPSNVVGSAALLGALRADEGNWTGAADAYAQAIAAAEAGVRLRLDDTGREREIRAIPVLHRRAAFALAVAGRVEEAVLALEAGRARALRARLPAHRDEELARLPLEVRDAFAVLNANAGAAPLGPAGAAARRELAELVEAIRTEPGLEDFAARLDLEQVVAAAEPGWPLVYVNPMPHGTLLLVVELGADRRARVEARLLDAPTGLELYGHLLVRGGFTDEDGRDDEDEDGEPRGSYLLSVAGQEDSAGRFHAALDDALAFVGEAIARPLGELLDELGALGVTLVLCGPLGAVPLGSAVYSQPHGRKCLIDQLVVRYAPSALVAAESMRRAKRSATSRRLCALADPVGDLPAAEPEVRQLADGFPARTSAVAVGRGASLRYLRRHAAGATHVHLACHAQGGLFDGGDAVVELADGRAGIGELSAIRAFTPRLVVVSACESAQSQMTELADEALSLGVAFVASGAACAIAALWSVDDVATALLMTRLYDELGDGHEPPVALGRAQRWLRDLDGDGLAAFEGEHLKLALALRTVPAGSRRSPLPSPGVRPPVERPFAHPDYWAGFVAVGA